MGALKNVTDDWRGGGQRAYPTTSPMTTGLVWVKPASVLLDLLFVISLVLTYLNVGPVLAFHVCFASLTLMSFAHAGRALVMRAVPGVFAVTAVVVRAVQNEELEIDELYEIPILVIMMAFAAWSVTLHRTLVSQLQSQSERLRQLHQASQIESREQLLLTQRLDTFGKMSAGLAHNCRNVMTTIISVAEQVEDTSDHEAIQESARQIQSLSHQGGQLITDMLHRVRPQVGDQVTDLNDVVDSERFSLATVVGRGVEFTVELDPQPLDVPLGRSLLEQILINLVLNAKEATDGAGMVRVATSRHPAQLPGYGDKTVEAAVLSVSDDGRGMSSEVIGQAFEPFFSTKQGRDQSSGLGLFTSLAIIEGVGGTIRITSEPGQGTEIRVTLPLASIDGGTSYWHRPALGPDQLFGSETILLVDDDDVLCDRLSATLSLYGYDVIEADGAADAVAKLAGVSIDLVVTDVMMPGRTGPQLVDDLYRAGIDGPTLYISGDERADDLVPVDAYLLAKPFSRTAFLTRVRGAILAQTGASGPAEVQAGDSR